MNVLMYHSVSRSPGPTSISPETFRDQLRILAECGYETISMPTFAAWHKGETEMPCRSVVITFDDGFADFAESAFPILSEYGYCATVFLPTGRMGHIEDWVGADHYSPRAIMSWDQARELARENIEFGGHSVTHADLTHLSAGDLRSEVKQSRYDIEEQLGYTPTAFAPPYGRAGAREQQEIRAHFDVSLGTRLNRCARQRDRFDIPRIEMHYFRDGAKWQTYLEGRAEWYLTARRALRRVRALAIGA